MGTLPPDYRISPERVPVPGAKITEAVSLDELLDFQAERLRLQQVAEFKKDEDKLLALTAAGLALTALGGIIIRHKFKGKG